MRTVWKYKIPLVDTVWLELPVGAKILKVAQQGEGVFLWALVDPEAPRDYVHLRVAGTGHEIAQDDAEHVDSFLMDGGRLVFHVFQIPKVKE